MHTTMSVAARPPTRRAATAAELMTPNPVSLRAQATVLEARELFIARAIAAAPVIDAAGRPVGVLSQSDILVHQAGSCRADPTTVEAYNGRGQAYFFLRKFDLAQADFTKAIEAGIVTPKLFLNRGKCRVHLGKFSEAIPDFDRSIELRRPRVCSTIP